MKLLQRRLFLLHWIYIHALHLVLHRAFALQFEHGRGVGSSLMEQPRYMSSCRSSGGHLHRRQFVATATGGAVVLGSLTAPLPSPVPRAQAVPIMHADENRVSSLPIQHPFQYSSEWTGTALPWLSLEEVVQRRQQQQQNTNNQRWVMGRWPDPILRRSADPVPDRLLGTALLEQACQHLRNTAVAEGAVGLAAQQCGVNARIIYLELSPPSQQQQQRTRPPKKTNGKSSTGSYLTMINPMILARSSEIEMLVWNENCLVLPPTFTATVLRDAWIDVAYQDNTSSTGQWHTIRLTGETARAAQHELDHDRGILVTDHVSLEEMETPLMQSIEAPGHVHRMALAYNRYIYPS